MKVTFPKGFFMRVIVIFCIVYIVYLTERSMAISEHIGSSVEGIYAAAIAFFGAELVMMLVKKIMSGKKKKEEDTE